MFCAKCLSGYHLGTNNTQMRNWESFSVCLSYHLIIHNLLLLFTQMMARPRHPHNPSQAHGVPGMGYPPMHYQGARQSPVPSAMMNMPPSQASQPIPRTSPVNRKTPPMMNLGQMTEVPYPSQASMPEETPIIRMSEYHMMAVASCCWNC